MYSEFLVILFTERPSKRYPPSRKSDWKQVQNRQPQMRTKTEIITNGHRILEVKMFLALAWRDAAHWAGSRWGSYLHTVFDTLCEASQVPHALVASKGRVLRLSSTSVGRC